MSIDSAYIRNLVSSNETSVSALKGQTQVLCLVIFIAISAFSIFQLAPHLLPMRAEDYQRLDGAIQALATARNSDADQIWQKIYFQFRTCGLSELKQSQVDDIGRFILEEMAKDQKG
ncbi:hypothetical protein [uncultured Cohaesibacter sp.]|uniref:hypothetical protein n=1 Tax=uncultured Cohaesibacter sp. TaxID=1002546 RepID=UPI0029C888FD|nr:hypothetical protein [uncultured Cohaesibacter sp.]